MIALLLAAAEAWGVPPWRLEREASVNWLFAFAEQRERDRREIERQAKRWQRYRSR